MKWQMSHMHARARNPMANGKAILVVEDHDELRTTLVEWLQSDFRNCTVLAAGSGEEAIELANTHHPAVVLMDIQLPKMNGIEAIRRIKKISPQTQAVILSVMNVSAYKEEAMAAGACAYINKQHMHTELIPALTKLLYRQTNAGEET